MTIGQRSHSPIFWLLFGAGGMLAALAGPALVVITGLWQPLGYAQSHAVAHNWIGKLFLFAAASLFAWHAVHRILCSLHDVGIHKTFGVKLVCYGVAGVITLVAGCALSSV